MEKIIVCLKRVESEYETKILDLKNTISIDSTKKPTLIKENYFSTYCEELQANIKEIDKQLSKKLNLLHKAWIEDYDKIYNLCVGTSKRSFLFKKKIPAYQYDRLQVYYDDLEATTKRIKSIIKDAITKISSLQIQEFLR